MRPTTGMEGGAPEGLRTGNVGHVGGRQASGSHDHELSAEFVTLSGAYRPSAGTVLERGPGHLGVEFDMGPQVESVRHMLEIAKDLGLPGVAFGPLPLLLELFGELVRVLHALDVAPCAGVAIPKPRAAHATPRLEHHSRETEVTGAVQHVQPGEPRSDDHYIELPPGFVHPIPPRTQNLSKIARRHRGDPGGPDAMAAASHRAGGDAQLNMRWELSARLLTVRHH